MGYIGPYFIFSPYIGISNLSFLQGISAVFHRQNVLPDHDLTFGPNFSPQPTEKNEQNNMLYSVIIKVSSFS